MVAGIPESEPGQTQNAADVFCAKRPCLQPGLCKYFSNFDDLEMPVYLSVRRYEYLPPGHFAA